LIKIILKKLSDFRFFTGLNKLQKIFLQEFDKIDSIEKIIDLKKVIYLDIEKLSINPEYMRQFFNLRNLQIQNNCEIIDFE
jgi:hypothetical protein